MLPFRVKPNSALRTFDAFSKVVYTANKDKQYRVFKEEVRSLASEVAAKHLAKSSSADQSAVNRVPGAGEGKVARSRPN